MSRPETNARHAAEASRLLARGVLGLASGLARGEFTLKQTTQDGVLEEPWPIRGGHGWDAWHVILHDQPQPSPETILAGANLHCYREAAGILLNYLHVLTRPGTYKTIWLSVEGCDGQLRPPTCRTEVTGRPIPPDLPPLCRGG